jgi:hypothetical protein
MYCADAAEVRTFRPGYWTSCNHCGSWSGLVQPLVLGCVGLRMPTLKRIDLSRVAQAARHAALHSTSLAAGHGC